MNKLDRFLGPSLAVSMVTICFGFLCYFGYLAQDQDFINKYPPKKNCGQYELEIAGYCCKTVEQYNTGDCTK